MSSKQVESKLRVVKHCENCSVPQRPGGKGKQGDLVASHGVHGRRCSSQRDANSIVRRALIVRFVPLKIERPSRVFEDLDNLISTREDVEVSRADRKATEVEGIFRAVAIEYGVTSDKRPLEDRRGA